MRLTRTNTGRRGRKSGEHLMISDRSGFRYPASEIVREWTGALVAKHEEEPRHPQEFVRGVVDDYAVRNPRPRTPYESTLSTGNTALSEGEIIDRFDANVVTRDGESILTRALVLGAGNSLLIASLGSVKFVSRVVFTFDFLTEGRDVLNFYTSEDGVNYTPLTQPFTDIIRSFQDGEPTSVSIGRRCQYIAIRFELPSGTIQPQFLVSQFDVIGEI